MLEAYRKHAAERAELGVLPLPLDVDQTKALCALLENPPAGEEDFLKDLLSERVAPGVDPSAEVKANWLGAVAHGETKSPLISREDAIKLLGTMMGGYNVPYIVRELEGDLAQLAAETLKHIIMIFDNFEVASKLFQNLLAQTLIRYLQQYFRPRRYI